MANVDDILYATLWALLEAEPTFAAIVRAGNRIRFDGLAPDPLKQNVQDGDLPECMIDHIGSTDPVYTSTADYSQTESADPADLGWTEVDHVDYGIICTLNDLRLGPANTLKAAIMLALRKGGPRLGYSWVTGWTVKRLADSLSADRDARGTRRRVLRMQVGIDLNLDGGSLLV